MESCTFYLEAMIRDIQYEKQSLMPANYDKTLERNRTERLAGISQQTGAALRRGAAGGAGETRIRSHAVLHCRNGTSHL